MTSFFDALQASHFNNMTDESCARAFSHSSQDISGTTSCHVVKMCLMIIFSVWLHPDRIQTLFSLVASLRLLLWKPVSLMLSHQTLVMSHSQQSRLDPKRFQKNTKWHPKPYANIFPGGGAAEWASAELRKFSPTRSYMLVSSWFIQVPPWGVFPILI